MVRRPPALSRLRWPLGALAAGVAALVGYLAAWPVPIAPVVWSPPPDPGPRTARTMPPMVVSTPLPEGVEGPEDVEIDAEGRVYGGASDGWIWRWDTPTAAPVHFAETGGRPLGLTWGPGGALLVADAFTGLWSVAPGGALTRLTDRCSGAPMRFTDDLEVGPDGRVWFSDASARFDQHTWKLDLIENVPSGRLCVFDPSTGVATAVLDGLAFANGIAVDPGGRFVLVCETARNRIRRWWLQGPAAGTDDVFLDGLPGFPDGMSQGAEGRFWIAIASPRNPALDAVAGWPSLRRGIVRLPDWLQPKPARYAHVMGVDADGRAFADLVDPAGTEYSTVTTVEERGDHLLLGSLTSPGWASVPTPGSGVR